jgi:hypothetical protein
VRFISSRRFCGNADAPCPLDLSAEPRYAQIVVHALAPPTGGGGVGVYGQIERGMRFAECGPFVRGRKGAAHCVELASVGSSEEPAAARASLETDVALMHQPMMGTAEGDEIG